MCETRSPVNRSGGSLDCVNGGTVLLERTLVERKNNWIDFFERRTSARERLSVIYWPEYFCFKWFCQGKTIVLGKVVEWYYKGQKWSMKDHAIFLQLFACLSIPLNKSLDIYQIYLSHIPVVQGLATLILWYKNVALRSFHQSVFISINPMAKKYVTSYPKLTSWKQAITYLHM